MDNYLLYQKQIDQSLLKEGFSIPFAFQNLFFQKFGFRLAKGEKCEIKILIDGNEYSAILKNNDFDESKYQGHTDVLQIRYSAKSKLSLKLRDIFSASTDYINEALLNKKDKKHIIIPEDKREYLVIYATPVNGTLLFDYITCDEYKSETDELRKCDEIILETALNAVDNSADIIIRNTSTKFRRLSKSIGQNLKIVYDYRCQICGRDIGENYGTHHIIQAHHIDYFTRSMNNNSDNIMVVCPNHHAVIHTANPSFNKNTKTYHYQNGYKEKLILNLHL